MILGGLITRARGMRNRLGVVLTVFCISLRGDLVLRDDRDDVEVSTEPMSCTIQMMGRNR